MGLSFKSWSVCIEQFLAAVNRWRSVRAENPVCSRPLQEQCVKTRRLNILTQENQINRYINKIVHWHWMKDSPFILKPL